MATVQPQAEGLFFDIKAATILTTKVINKTISIVLISTSCEDQR